MDDAHQLPGELGPGCTAKDLILGDDRPDRHRRRYGYVIEYPGDAIRGLSMEGRMTIANMSIEAGARAGMIAPDETTFAYLEGRRARRRTSTRRSSAGGLWTDTVPVRPR